MMKIIDRKFLSVQTPSCHASSIAFHSGYPVFAWFGGQREGLPDSSIYVEYKDGIRNLGTNVQVSHWNPILFNNGGELFLVYKVGKFCDSWQTFILNITDIENIGDLNKVKKQVLHAGLNFAVKTKPIEKDGVIYCGSSAETMFDWASWIETYIYKEDEFVLLERSLPLAVPKKHYKINHPIYGSISSTSMGIIQPSLWMDSDDVLHAFFRSSSGLSKIYYSKGIYLEKGEPWSRQWSSPSATRFDNPNSGMDVVYVDGRLFLVYNPSSEKRYPLIISELNYKFEVIDEVIVQDKVDSGIRTLTSELSYPYMVEYKNKLHLTYTYGRKFIEYVTIEI